MTNIIDDCIDAYHWQTANHYYDVAADFMAKSFDEHFGDKLVAILASQLPTKRVRERHVRLFNEFAKWCAHDGLRALPSGGGVAASYLIYLAVVEKKPLAHIKRADAAIRFVHKSRSHFLDEAYLDAALAVIREIGGGGNGGE